MKQIRDFKQASDEAVKEGFRKEYWQVYDYYCLVGPEGVISCTGGVEDPKRIQDLNPSLYKPEEWPIHDLYIAVPHLVGDIGVDGPSSERPRHSSTDAASGEETERGDEHPFWTFWRSYNKDAYQYSPLTVPGLFLEFASLVEEEPEITPDAMLDWVVRNGVPGLEESYHGRRSYDLLVRASGGPGETLGRFAYEAKKANAVLRLYEATTGPERLERAKLRDIAIDLINEGIITGGTYKKYLYGDLDTLQDEEVLLDWVTDSVQEVVARDCYPVIYWEEGRFFQGWGFHSLLGAMYLQMMWLITATGEVSRCEGPGCSRVIRFELPQQPLEDPGLKKNARGKYKTRSDKRFCSTNCRVKWHYHNKKRAIGKTQS